MGDIKKVVLAYSGGLDTSVILKWLQDEYKCEVVTFTADLGQGEELEPARAKAKAAGVKEIYIDDVREEFVRDFVFPMFRANTVYEGEYLLGTSIARPLIAKRLIEIANETGADAISHGATGKGNDQVRFELGAYALKPNIHIIAPWREWDLLSREKLLAYAEKHGIPVEMKHKQGGSPYSMDANLLHISYEGRHLENPAAEAEEDMWRWTVSPEKAPDAAEYIDIEYLNGDPVALDGKKMKAHEILAYLNKVGGKHGIGRLDLVENRYVGFGQKCAELVVVERLIGSEPDGGVDLAHRGLWIVFRDRQTGTAGGFQVDDELAGVGARKKRDSQQREQPDAENKNDAERRERRHGPPDDDSRRLIVEPEECLEPAVEPDIEAIRDGPAATGVIHGDRNFRRGRAVVRGPLDEPRAEQWHHRHGDGVGGSER